MRQPPPPRSGGSARWRRPGTALLTSALLLGTALPALSLAAATSAHADSGSMDQLVPQQTGPDSEPTPPGSSTLPLPSDATASPAELQALTTARTKAIATGKAVVADALTTETSTISAEASGRFLYESSVLPVRVRKGAAWTAVDTSLQPVPGGGFAPKAATASVVFSGGGTTPLATMAGPDGASLALTWPTALPTPTVAGDTLTYASVLPSVDLKVTATVLGGFSETLVVKTAAAAADPALATLRLGTRTHGVVVSSDAFGNLTGSTPAGRPLFHAPAPAMWDSSTTAPAAARTAGTGRSLAGAADAPAAADAAPAIASTSTEPGSAARVAPVAAHVSGATISLVPNKAMLTARTNAFPLFVDPTWVPLWQTALKQHFTEIQQGCAGANSYDSTTYGNPAAGLNSFSGCIGVERSYYQLGIPTKIFGATTKVDKATFNLKETYSASCSTTSMINLRSTGPIGKTTTWNAQPTKPTTIKSASIGPACTSQPSTGFDIAGFIGTAANKSTASVTFGVFNANESSGLYFKRFATNPTINIEYDHPPNTPSASDTKVTGTDLGCDTTSPYALLGKIDGVSTIGLSAHVSDPDGDSTQTTFKYWLDGSSTKNTLLSVNGVASGGTAGASIPVGFVSGLADGVTVDWQTTSITDGHLTNSTAGPVCHFTMSLHSPTLIPKVVSVGAENTPSVVSVTSSDPKANAVKIVYQLDSQPPSSNAPAYETLSGSQVVNGAATITVTPPGPGIHTLNIVGYSAAGNSSTTSVPLIVPGAPGTGYAKFSDALNSTAVSSNTNTAAADADGAGNSLSLQDLQTAGWTPGGKVTVDGATFTLPNFGSGKDNVLADNQTIGLGGATGDSLVVLAFGTYSGSQLDEDPGAAIATSPHIPAGTKFAGSDCTMPNSATSGAPPLDCQAASGTLTYDDTSVGGTGDGTVPYALTVPDWTYGAPAYSVLTLPHRNVPGNTQTTATPSLYAFAIHLQPGKTLKSITLPDVSGPARNTGNTLGSPLPAVPALHILGLAVRNSTVDTAGNTWTGAWSAPAENQYAYTGNTHYTSLTWRTALVPSVSGTRSRIHLSNQQSKNPLTLTHVTLATQSTATGTSTSYGGSTVATPGFSPAAASTPTNVTFGGSASVTIPAGGDIYSDPVTAVPVRAGVPLLVSMATADAATVEGHLWTSDSHTWISAKGAGDHTADTAGTTFTATGSLTSEAVNILSGLDTVTADGQKTVAVLGDGLVGPYTSGTKPATAASGPRLSDVLSNALGGQSAVPVYGVVNAGVENNSLVVDAPGNSGRSAMARMDRDLLSEPGLQTVVVDTGLVDAVGGQSEDVITTAYKAMAAELNAWGVQVVFTTLTPCSGFAACTTANDTTRADVNTALSDMAVVTPGQYNTVVTEDMEGVVATDPDATPEVLATAFDSGDHVNLKPAAQLAMFQDFTLGDLVPGTIPAPGPVLTPAGDWALTEGSGSTMSDSTPDGNALTGTGTSWGQDSKLPQADPTQAAGNPNGTDLVFDGSTSYADFGGSPFLDPDQSYRVDTWVKLNTLGSGDQLAVSQDDGTQQSLTLGYSGSTGRWTFTVQDNSSPAVPVTVSGPLAVAGAWTHLVAYYDQDKSLIHLDVNGVAAGEVPGFTPATAVNPSNFSLGAATAGDPTAGPLTLSGQLNGALSHTVLSD